jgi:hypothetical protein
VQTKMVTHPFITQIAYITIFVNLGFFWHFETIIDIRTWIKSHIY